MTWMRRQGNEAGDGQGTRGLLKEAKEKKRRADAIRDIWNWSNR